MKNKNELIDFYFQEVRALLNPTNEEIEKIRSLFVNGEGVSNEDRNKLIESCLLFAANRAKNAYGRLSSNEFPIFYEDLIQAANFGLVEAAGTYNGSTKFITHAKFWIKEYIKRWIKNDRLVHIPINVSESSPNVSLLDYVNEFNGDDDTNYWSSGVEDTRLLSPSILYEAKLYLALIRSLLKKINECPKIKKSNFWILSTYYGLDRPSKTLEAIGLENRLSKEGVRRLIKRTLEKIKKILLKDKASEYLFGESGVNLRQVKSPDWLEALLEMRDSLKGILNYRSRRSV